MSDTPRTVAVCEKLIAWATKNPNATIGDAVKFIVETFTEDMAEVERELNEAQKTITEFREWSIGGVAASEWKNRAETAEAKLIAKPDVAGLVRRLCMSKLFDAPELTAERKEAADALLSLSAQLQEKEAECNAKTEVLLEAQRIAAQAQAECEGLRQDAAFCMVF